jgi:aminomethyltransferase
MVEFAGFLMPIQYAGIVPEHRRVRATAGLFDVSHMAEFYVHGRGAVAALERLTTNRVEALDVGRVQYSALCYEHGGFIDDLLVYRLADSYMLVVNAANKEKDLAWIRGHLGPDTAVEDASDGIGLVAIQGPASEAVLRAIAEGDVAGLRYYRSAPMAVAGRKALVSRTGYTGEDGFEVYASQDAAPVVWDALLEAGRSSPIEPVGLGARDTLRLEMGYALYGSDIDDAHTPLEANLMWITKMDKGPFIGRDAIAKRVRDGQKEALAGFELLERGIPRHGQRILAGGRSIGSVTSGTFSPSLEKGIGMGYVPPGTKGGIEIEIRDRLVPARIVQPPFYRQGSIRRS